jgi:hypothetical protein
MSMIFYTYKVPGSCPLASMGAWNIFIAYNPLDGETAFFNVNSTYEVVPFNDVQMAYVASRWREYCQEVGQPLDTFNPKAHEDFMRSL